MDFLNDVGLIKAGLDALRTALSLVKDVQGVLPVGEKKDTVALSLMAAERQLRLADAQIAKGFGYALCKCQAPVPSPMVLAGHFLSASSYTQVEVFECAACGSTTMGLGKWRRLNGTIEDTPETMRELLEHKPARKPLY